MSGFTGGGHTLRFYDAAFQKNESVNQTIAGIDVAKLSQQMSEIDWKKAFDFNERKSVGPGDKAAFEKELKIEAIINELAVLQATQDGKSTATYLKLLYWSGSAYYDVYGNISGPKNKVEVSQRFYFMEGQPGISVDEAYRYLQNRWLEKEMLLKKKRISEPDAGSGNYEKGSGRLRKRRTRTTRVSKSEK